MSDDGFDELAGRIEGVARVLGALIADLEVREQLDGDRFGRGLRRMADGMPRELRIAARTVRALTDSIEAARIRRGSAG